MTRTALLCLCALSLSMLAATCEPQVPPTDPGLPEDPEPTRQELCTGVCERYVTWKCEKAEVCSRFADEPAADGSLECAEPGSCVQDCVQNPGAWPESLECVLNIGVSGPVPCAAIEEQCRLPGGT